MAELPRVVGRCGAAQLSQAGLSGANVSRRERPVLGRLFDASPRGGSGEWDSGGGYGS